MKVNIILNKPDLFGALVSVLCIIHCIITPFLFIVHSCSLHGCASTPTWWKSIDYLFIVLSFFAIRHAIKKTSKKIIKPALWGTWLLLLATVTNEKMQWLELTEYAVYIPALALVVLHLYNLKYCQCKNDKCCTKND